MTAYEDFQALDVVDAPPPPWDPDNRGAITGHPFESRGVVAVEREVGELAAKGRRVRHLRPLDVRCAGQRRHRIAAVYAVPGDGPVLTGQVDDWHESDQWQEATATVTDAETGEEYEVDARSRIQRHTNRAGGPVALVVGAARKPWEKGIYLQCRCSTEFIAMDWVREMLASGRSQVRVR